jgi:hypothetical protein
MNQYHKLYTPADSAIVFIDDQPQMLFGVANDRFVMNKLSVVVQFENLKS